MSCEQRTGRSGDCCLYSSIKTVENVSNTKILLFHGLLSSPQEFGLIAHSLRSKGLRHEAVTIPGYSLAADDVTFDWQRWRTSAADVIGAKVSGNEPVILGGLCVGGVLAAALALQAPTQVAGVVLLSPSFDFDGWGLSPVRHLRRIGYWTGLDRFFSVTERSPYGVKDERIRAWIARELQERRQSAAGPARVPLRALREAERMLTEVRARLHELRCPILMVHARDDEITRIDSVERLFNSLPQADKELVVLENSYHMITIDNDRQEVVAALDRFTRRCRSNARFSPDVTLPRQMPT
jgi:carboxylesterase